MKILDFKDNQVIVDPHILAIQEFKVLWDRDKSKGKESAFADLAFLYHMYDYNSTYANYPEDKREETVINDIIRKKEWKQDKEIKAAGKKYMELSETPKQRLLKAAKYKIDEIAKFLKETPLDRDSADSVLSMFKNISTTIANFDKLEDAVTKEQEKGKSHVRGNRDVALFEQ